MLTRFFRLPLLMLQVSALSACMAPATPQEVAEGFWQAVKHQDTDALAELSDVSELQPLPLQDKDWQQAVISFGRITIDGTRAEVATSITGLDREAEHARELTTYLNKTDEQWRVDFPATRESLENPSLFHQFMGQLDQLTERLGSRFGQSSADWSEQMQALAEKLDAMSESARENADEMVQDYSTKLQQQLDALSEYLQQQLDDHPEASAGDRQLLQTSVDELDASSEQLDEADPQAVAGSFTTLERVTQRLTRLKDDTFAGLKKYWQRTQQNISEDGEQWQQTMDQSI